MHIGAKKEASKRPWVAGFVYLGRFRRSACPSLRRIGAVKLVRNPRKFLVGIPSYKRLLNGIE